MSQVSDNRTWPVGGDSARYPSAAPDHVVGVEIGTLSCRSVVLRTLLSRRAATVEVH